MLRSEIVRRILEARGIAGAELEAFLNPALENLAGAEGLPGAVAAADVVLDAVAARRKIVVFGDYDCDGVCAAAILVRTLSALGADVAPFLPNRFTEGYGMSDAAVARMFEKNPGVGLVVTVDNGINSVSQVAGIRARGVSVVVTDHHLPGDALPDADALVNPKVDAPEALSNLCGAGVAFMIAGRIVSEAKRRGMYEGPSIGGPLLVMAGLATVTDVMPLVGQNRILVAEALKRFDRLAPVGLRELYLRAARSGGERHTTRDFSHLLGPRMNAAGRVAKESGVAALNLALADDRESARGFAMEVDGYNVQRKAEEQKMVEEALAKIVPDAPAQVIDLPDGHPGVAGIVAARVMERIGERSPVCVIAGGHGSARSPDGLNIRDALAACGDVLDSYGGHAAAAGFVVTSGKVDAFRERLCAVCAGAEFAACEMVDAWIEPSDATLDLVDELQLLEPFGEGNPEPVFGIRNAVFSDVRPLGSDGRHLVATLRGSGLRAVYWNAGDRVERMRAEGAVPRVLRFRLAESTYGERHVELHLLSAG